MRGLEAQRGSATAAQVRAYWNAHPVTVDKAREVVGSLEAIQGIYRRWQVGIDEYRLKFLESCRGKKVLEVGCGIGVDARWLVENGIDYRGVDYSFHSLELCRKMLDAANLRCGWVNADATALPFADEQFDLVFSIGVLHHVPGMEQACREIVRVAKPGATVRVMLYNRHSYHYALVKYVVVPLIWLMIWVPGLSALAALAPEKFRQLYLIAKQDGFDPRRILNSSTDTSSPGERNFNPLSRFLTEREARVLFDELEDFDFTRRNLSFFPVPFVRRIVERRFGFHLTFTARKARGGVSEPSASRDLDTAQGYADYFRSIGAGSLYTPEQFRDFFQPLDPEAFRGRRVVELGFGHGSFLWHWERVGPSRLAGVDLGDAVDTARAKLAHLPEGVLDLRRGDFTEADLGPHDLAFCIGVIHHMRDPRQGFLALLRHTAPGGCFHGRVYPREGNGIALRVLDAIRRAGASLPWWATKWGPGLAIGTALWVWSGLLRRLPRRLAARLPAGAYCLSLGPREFAFFHFLATDFLVARHTVYLDRPTLDSWLGHPDVEPGSTYLIHRNGNSWTFGGRRRLERVGRAP